MVSQLELGSRTAWLIYFYLGTDSETDLEVRKLPAMLRSMRVGESLIVVGGDHITYIRQYTTALV